MSDKTPAPDLLKVTERLIDVLERESELLRAMKPSDTQALHEDKVALTAAYEDRIKALKAEPRALSALPANRRAELNGTIKRFQAALSENARSLHAAKQASQSALNAIAEEVQRYTQKHAGYSASGVAAPPSASGQASAMSFAFDQRL